MSDDPISDDLQKRMAKLERQNRLLWICVIFPVSMWISVIINSYMEKQPLVKAEAIETQDLKVVDKDRRMRAHLHIDDDGGIAMSFFDKSGVQRAGLSEWEKGMMYLSFAESIGKPTLSLGYSYRGGDTPGLKINDNNGSRLIDLGVGRNDSPGLGMMDKEGKLLFKAP